MFIGSIYIEHKICLKCKFLKSYNEFSFHNKKLNIRRATCKLCRNIASKKIYENTRNDIKSVARRILKKCREREKERLSKFIKRRDNLNYFPEVELNQEQFDIDIEWMLEQRIKQDNKCWYTGITMMWSTGLIDEVKRMNPRVVTIERLDSFKFYTKDNCVLSSWWANCAKGPGTLEELINFSFETIKKYIISNNLELTDDIIYSNKKLFLK